jgi:hypothetical protein
MQTKNYQTVAKEQIHDFSFFSQEVLKTEQEIQQRRSDMYKAMILGNSYLYKVKIYFETDEGSRVVETTVWFAADRFIVLKGDVTIPVHCITKIEF